MSILFYSNCSNPQHGLAILKSVRVPTQRDLPIIIYISVDFLQQLLRGIFRLQSLMDLLSFYFGFNFFSHIKRVQYRTGIEPRIFGLNPAQYLLLILIGGGNPTGRQDPD